VVKADLEHLSLEDSEACLLYLFQPPRPIPQLLIVSGRPYATSNEKLCPGIFKVCKALDD